jgi:hypothetical protein
MVNRQENKAKQTTQEIQYRVDQLFYVNSHSKKSFQKNLSADL